MKNNWLLLILISFAVLSLLSVTHAQTAGKTQQSIGWKQEKIEKYGISTILIPKNSVVEIQNEQTHQNNDLTWTDYYLNYRIPVAHNVSYSIEVSISVQIWDTDFSKLSDRKPELATPEKLLEFELAANSKKIIPEGIGINSLEYYPVDGTKGILTKGTTGENRLRVIWHVLRYYENKPQNITVAVSCLPNELPLAMKIIDSLTLSK